MKEKEEDAPSGNGQSRSHQPFPQTTTLSADSGHNVTYIEIPKPHIQCTIRSPSKYIANAIKRKFSTCGHLLHVDCQPEFVCFVTQSQSTTQEIQELTERIISQLTGPPQRRERLYLTGVGGMNKNTLTNFIEERLGDVLYIKLLSDYKCADYGHSAIVEILTSKSVPESLVYPLQVTCASNKVLCINRSIKIAQARPRLDRPSKPEQQKTIQSRPQRKARGWEAKSIDTNSTNQQPPRSPSLVPTQSENEQPNPATMAVDESISTMKDFLPVALTNPTDRKATKEVAEPQPTDVVVEEEAADNIEMVTQPDAILDTESVTLQDEDEQIPEEEFDEEFDEEDEEEEEEEEDEEDDQLPFDGDLHRITALANSLKPPNNQ
jgi:hypothetical protein